MKQPTIAVFGDGFEDIYYIGTTNRISPEAPIPVVKITNQRSFPGGASNVILNLHALGAEYLPLCKIGPSKNRLCVGDYQLARWDENDSNEETDLDLVNDARAADAVIISDYGKGSITYAVIEAIAALNLPTFIDTKRSPRDFDVVMNPTFFPNQKEYESHIQDYRVQPKVVLKRGAEGIQFMKFGKVEVSYPTFATKVVSVCGAGDTVIATYVYSLMTDHPENESVYLANCAAGLVVAKPWTATVAWEEVWKDAITRRS